MIGNSNAWNAAGEKCDVCGENGEMQIDVNDEEGYETSTVLCLTCLQLIVRGEFSELSDKQRNHY